MARRKPPPRAVATTADAGGTRGLPSSSFARGMQSMARFGQRALAVFDAIANRLAKLQTLAEVFLRIRDFGVAAFTELARAVGFATLAVNQLAVLLSNITRIPLGIVSAALATVAASILAAVVPTWMWAAALKAVVFGFGILKAAAISGLPVIVGWLQAAAASAWALAAPIAAAASPFLAVAAAVAAAYAVMTRWQDFPAWLKVILLAASPLVLVIRGIATALDLAAKALGVLLAIGRAAFGALKMAASAVLLPVTLIRDGIGLVVDGLGLIPAAASAMASATGRALQATGAAVAELGAALWNFGTRYVQPVVDAFGRMSSSASAKLQSISDRVGSVAATVQGWADSLTGLASRITAPLTSAGNMAATAGARIAALAAAAGIGAATMSEFAYASERAGVSAESVANAIGAAGGLDNFLAYAEQIRAIADPMEQAAEAQRRFGEAGGAALELIRRGPAYLSAMRTEVGRLGLVMDGPAAESARVLTEVYRTLRDATTGLWQTVGRAVVPALTEAARTTTDLIKATTAWVAKNQPLIAQAFRIASIVASVGAGLGALATVLGTVAAGFATAAGVVGAVGAALTAVGGAVAFILTPAAVLAATVGAIAAAFGVLAPLAASVGVALAAAPALWARFGSSATAAYESVRSAGAAVVRDVTRVTDGVRAAIAGGDLEAAVNIAWLGIRKAWADGLVWLSKSTGDTFGGILQALSVGDWRSAATQAWTALQIVFEQGVGSLDRLWVGLQDTVGEVVLYMRSAFADAIQQVAQFAVAALGKLSDFAGILAAYDPTGQIMTMQRKAAGQLGGSALNNAARGGNFGEAMRAAEEERQRQQGRAGELAQREATRQASIIALRGQQVGAQLGAGNAATDRAADLETQLAKAIAEAELARDRARAADAEQAKAVAAGAEEARKKAVGIGAGGTVGNAFGATFSAASLMSLGNGRPRVEKAVEATAGNTKKLVEIETKRLRQERAMQLEFVA